MQSRAWQQSLLGSDVNDRNMVLTSCRQVQALLQKVPPGHILETIIEDIANIVDSVAQKSIGYLIDTSSPENKKQLLNIRFDPHVKEKLQLSLSLSSASKLSSSELLGPTVAASTIMRLLLTAAERAAQCWSGL